MIKSIQEINFPSYATLNKATVTLNDMGEKTITSQVAIDGEITPDFSFDWEVVFKGEKYIMPLRVPQGMKDNTSFNSKIDLTFQHWAIYQLKRWYFFTLQNVEAGIPVADKYIASVSLNLKNFCDYFSQILDYYFNGSITIDLNPQWEYVEDATYIDINYSYLWDVLVKLYELFGVRWEIKPNGSVDKYVIKVGYPVTEMNHIFEYGFEGGLMKVERQVQDENIRNMLLGRGGDKNIPLRYFKNVDPENPSFPADPDWIPELANVYFDRLRSAEFRSYVQGWKAQRYYNDSLLPNFIRTVSISETAVPWAYWKGYHDKRFDPVEFVADEIARNTFVENIREVAISPVYTAPIIIGSSIDKYGPLLGGLENNDDIYPSIQGVVIDPMGRIDQVVDVEQVTNNNIDEEKQNEINTWSEDLPDASITFELGKLEKKKVRITSDSWKFIVPQGYVANLKTDTYAYSKSMFYTFKPGYISRPPVDLSDKLNVLSDNAVAIDSLGQEVGAEGLKEGSYQLAFYFDIENTDEDDEHYSSVFVQWGLAYVCASINLNNISIQYAPSVDSQKNEATFDIWIKNIWQTTKRDNESDEAYAERVWKPILGNHLGDEAAVCFSSGLLSTSEDYTFLIRGKAIKNGIHYDTSKSLDGVQSHWRLTLVRSTADYDSLGKLVPNLERQGKAGDYFYFTGIELTKYYVEWAEKRLHDYKADQLEKVKDIQPSWVVSLDKVRIGTPHYDDTKALIDQLGVGGRVRIADKRFIGASNQLYLYLQQITYKYNESQNTVNITPNIEVILGTEYQTMANPVTTIQSQIDAIHNQIGGYSMSNIQQIVRMVGDRIYLRKDGLTDRSQSITYFSELLASLGFRQAMVGGYGWGFFKDENGKWVLETDRLNVRDEMQVNSLVINQIQARGGMIIESTASIEVSKVEELSNSYKVYFDTKNGSLGNLFRLDDVAYCHRYTKENQDLKYYKRKVIDLGEDYITLSKTIKDGQGVPSEGDVIVQYGNYTDKERQYVIIRDMMGGGYERMLSGLNSVTAIGNEYYFAGYQSSTGERLFIGTRTNDQYIEYVNGKLYIPGQLILGSDTGGGKTMLDYIKENGGLSEEEIERIAQEKAQAASDKAQKDAEDYADKILKAAQDYLQSQIDGAIETWFYKGVPTLTNDPAKDWKTDEQKNIHLGDLYYDQDTGKCYRFQIDDKGNYEWREITDTDIQAAMEAANKAQETADHKMRVFIDTPKPPYDEGDLWVNATYGNLYSNDILKCKVNIHRGETDKFSINDWAKASKYTDDSSLELFKEEYNQYKQDIEGQLDKKAETWYQSTDPSQSARPDGWKGEPNSEHVGDLWYNTSNHTTQRWTGTQWEAMSVPDTIFDWIDGKSSIFVSKPKDGYEVNDLWFLEEDYTLDKPYKKGTLVVAIKSRDKWSDTESPKDWTKKDAYIDEVDLNKWSDNYFQNIVQPEIKKQVDGKAETWYQADDPSKNWNDEEKEMHIGDLWYNTTNNTAYYWTGNRWVEGNIPQDVFDKFDGKADIFVSQPLKGYHKNDLWFLEQPYTLSGTKYDTGTLVVATNETSRGEGEWYANDWTKKDKYTDDTYAHGFDYLSKALVGGRTEMEGGLILSTLIALGTWDGAMQTIYSGINGMPLTQKDDPKYEEKGYGIAAWYGGDMLDAAFEKTGRLAKSLFRFDGSGYLAGNKIGWRENGSGWLAGENITWDESGAMTFGSGIHIGSGDSDTTFATLINFSNAFVPIDKNGETTWAKITTSNPLVAIKAKKGFYSDEFISVKGISDTSGSGIGGKSYLRDLLDVTLSELSDGDALVYNAQSKKWINGKVSGGGTDTPTTIAWDKVTGKPSWIGATKPSYSWSEINDKPSWIGNTKPTYAWNEINDKPTTIGGYGITDAKIENGVITLGENTITPLTAHQTIYTLTLKAGKFTAGSYTPNSAAKTINVPTNTSHLTNDSDFMTNAKFDELFEKEVKDGVTMIKAKFGFYSVGFVSAKGVSDATGGGGKSYLSQLLDVALGTLSNGDILVYNSTLKKWTNQQLDLSNYLTSSSLKTLTIQKNGAKAGTYTPTADATINISDVASAATLSSHINNTTIHITAAERTKWNNVAAIMDSDEDAIINKWNEVVNFLDTYTEADTLANLLSNKANTSDVYTKTESDGKYVNLTGTQTITGVKTFNAQIKIGNTGYASDGERPTTGVNVNGIQGTMAGNDQWAIFGYGTASDTGYLEIATGDNGNEAIYVSQYTSGSPLSTGATRRNSITLMNASGNQEFNAVSAKTLTITSTDGSRHISFSRGGLNYITASTAGGILAFVTNGLAQNEANSTLILTQKNGYPGTTNVGTWGLSTYRWANVYSVLGNFSGLITASAGIKIGDATITWDADNKGLKISNGGLYSESYISAKGVSSSSGGGGTAYNRLDDWSKYTDAAAGYALSAKLGYGLYTTQISLSNSVVDLTRRLATVEGAYVTLGTAQTITGVKTFNANVLFGSGLKYINTGSPVMIGSNVSSGEDSAYYYYHRIDLGYHSSDRINIYEKSVTFNNNGNTQNFATIDSKGVTAIAFIKTGGKSSQFLKADGSVDSNAYALNSTLGDYVTLNTAQTLTGWKCFQGGIGLKMVKDTSNALGIEWRRNDDTSVAIAAILYHNTAQRLFLNSQASTSMWEDKVGNYSLKIGVNELTYNTYPILRSDNYTSYVTKIGTADKGSASLPIYLNAGVPTACTASSLFSNLSMSGNNVSVTVAGQNRTLNVTAVGNWKYFTFTKTDNSGNPTYLLLCDVTTWYNTESGNSGKEHYFQGIFRSMRTGNLSGCWLTTINAICKYNRSYYRLEVDGNHNVFPRVVSYNGKYYLALYCTSSGFTATGLFVASSDIVFTNEILCDSSGGASGLSVVFDYSGMGVLGNATTATTLQTSRKIWGQSFNGGADVTGDMTNVGSVQHTDGRFYLWVDSGSGSICCCSTIAKTSGLIMRGTAIRFQNTTGVTSMIIKGANVGIGISDPTKKLHVVGESFINSSLIVANNTTKASATSGSITIGGATISWDDTNKCLKVDTGFYSDSFISAKGLSSGLSGGSGSGDGGASYNRLDDWNKYTSDKEGWVLSAKLGYGLYTTQVSLSNSVVDLTRRLATVEGAYVTLGTAQTITGKKTFNSDINFKFTASDTTSYPPGTAPGLYWGGSSDSCTINWSCPKGNDGTLHINHTDDGDEKTYFEWKGVVSYAFSKTTLLASGVTATFASIKREAGTSAQFLKADGSIDSSTYLTTSSAASTYVTLTTAQNITGYKRFVGGFGIRMNNDTSNAVSLAWIATDNATNIATITYHNTAQNIFINPQASASVWSDKVGNYSLKIGVDSLTYNTYPILHSNNYSSYALPRSGGSMTNTNVVTNLNADMLDGVHNGDVTAIKMNYLDKYDPVTEGDGLTGFNISRVYNNGYPCSFGFLYHTAGKGGVELLMGWSGSDNGIEHLYYRNKRDNATTWSNWRTIAFTTDNVASATQLQNSRTIWGQSFNGTGNVSGNMTGVGTISANGDNVITKTSATVVNFTATNSVGSVGLRMAASGNRGMVDVNANKWIIGCDGTNTFLSFGGNVGIDTTSPAQKLHVNGNAQATRFISTQATGTAPFTVSSTTKVTNLRADMADHIMQYNDTTSDFNDIGKTTDNCGKFYYSNSSNTNANKPDGVGNYGLFNMRIGGGYVAQIVGYRGTFYSRYYNSDTPAWSQYKQFAYITDNVASATKLQTARTLWGQSFNGTANVSGDMTSVGSISASGEITTTSANAFRAINKNYGCIIRNDGGSLYFLLTNEGDTTGSWNDLRPFRLQLSNGYITMGNGALCVQHGGNVGVGTSSPSYKLHVSGTLCASSSATVDTLNIANTSATSHLSFARNSYNYIVASGESATLNFVAGANGGASANVTMCVANKKVGICTASPSKELHVVGTALVNSSLIVANNATQTSATSGSITIGGAKISWDNTNKCLKVDTGFYSDSFISAKGLSTTSGGDAINLASISSNLLPSTTKTYNIGSTTRVWGDIHAKKLFLYYDVANHTDSINILGAAAIYGSAQSLMYFRFIPNNQNTGAAANLFDACIQAGSVAAGSTKWSLTNLILEPDGGNVGIGTTVPEHMLHVNGDIFTSGKLTAKSVSASEGNITLSQGSYIQAIQTSATADLEGWKLGYVHTSGTTIQISILGRYANATNNYIGLQTKGNANTELALQPNDGTVRIGAGAAKNGRTLFVYGTIGATGAISANITSDQRLKTDFEMGDYVDIILSFGNVMTFKYNSIAVEGNKWLDTTTRHTGLIYQNVKNANIPDFTGVDDRGYGWINYLSADYQATVLGALISTILVQRSIQNDINALRQRIKELEQRVKELEEA